MRFYLRKKRQPPAVIIVALIDVLIVVLIFLMVTTTFRKPMASLRLALPESSHATKAGANENAPLMGLVGTIYGMMTLFSGLGANGMGDNTVLAAGISLILRFTMMGVLIAIPSLIAWSYYTK